VSKDVFAHQKFAWLAAAFADESRHGFGYQDPYFLFIIRAFRAERKLPPFCVGICTPSTARYHQMYQQNVEME
jgi:hypothetical protein